MEITSTPDNDTSEDISSSIVLGGDLLAGDCCTGTVHQGLHVIARLMIGVKISEMKGK